MECMNSLGGSVIVFSQIAEVLFVDVPDGDLVVEGVHLGVLHDGLDPFFLGKLGQFAAGGGVGEIFCRGGEEEVVLNVLDSQGLDEYGFGATPCESRSISVGKKRWLSPPSRMEIWPEWCEVVVPVDDLHFEGTGKENPKPLLPNLPLETSPASEEF